MKTSPTGTKADWRRVAAHVVARRTALGLTQEQLAAEAGISATSLRYIETAERTSYRALTLARLASALGWRPSEFAHLLAGGDPETEDEDQADYDDDRISLLVAQVEDLSRKVDLLCDRLIGRSPRRRP